MEKVKIGFIGAGNFANATHYPSLVEIEDTQIVAICDLDKQRLEKTASKYNISNRFTDYKKLCDRMDLDAVYIVLPPKLLRDIALHCLSEGLNVFVEKPPGINLKQTEEMADIAAKKGCLSMVGFNRRFIPVLREAKSIIERKGQITLGVGEFHKFQLGDSPYWGTSSWLLVDAIHQVDAVRWLGGKVKEVKAYIQSFKSNCPNIYSILFQFENGSNGILIANYASGARKERFEIHGEGIAAYVYTPDRAEIYQENRQFVDPKPAIVLKGSGLAGSQDRRITYGYLAEDQHFIDCIKKEREPETSLKDAVEDMRIVEKVLRIG